MNQIEQLNMMVHQWADMNSSVNVAQKTGRRVNPHLLHGMRQLEMALNQFPMEMQQRAIQQAQVMSANMEVAKTAQANQAVSELRSAHINKNIQELSKTMVDAPADGFTAEELIKNAKGETITRTNPAKSFIDEKKLKEETGQTRADMHKRIKEKDHLLSLRGQRINEKTDKAYEAELERLGYSDSDIIEWKNGGQITVAKFLHDEKQTKKEPKTIEYESTEKNSIRSNLIGEFAKEYPNEMFGETEYDDRYSTEENPLTGERQLSRAGAFEAAFEQHGE